MPKKDNIIKQVCAELGITQKQLAERMGVTPPAVAQWATGKNGIPKWALRMIELLRREQSVNTVVDQIEAFHKTIKKII